MPAALPILVAAAAGGVSAALAGTAILTGALIGGALAAAQSLLAPKPPGLSTQRPDTRGTVVAAVEGARWIVGRARTGGSLKFYQESGPDSRYAWMAFAISEGECDSIENIYIDGMDVSFTRNGNELEITDANFMHDDGAPIRIWEYFDADGTQGSEFRQRITDNSDEEPNNFSSDHKFVGISWIAVELFQPKYSSAKGRFWARRPTLQFVVKGMKLTWPGQSTPAWTENVAAVRYWVERERGGILAGGIDSAAFTSAYNLCNAAVTIPSVPAGYTASGIRYSANGTIADGMALDDVRAELDWAWQGWAVESGGVLYFRPGADRTSAADLTEDDLLGIEGVRPAPALQSRINALSMSLFQSKDNDFLEYDVPEIEDSPALSRDDNHYLPQNTGQRLFVNGPVDAARLMTIGLRRNRTSMTLSVRIKPGDNLERFSLIPSDIVTLTLPEYGFSDFRCMIQAITVNDDLSVALALDEDLTGAFADNLVLPPLRRRNISIPGARSIPPVQNLAGDEIAVVQMDGTLVTFLEITFDDATVARTEIQIREDGETDWEAAESTVSNRFLRPGVTVGTTYEFRARHVGRDGHAGEWSSEVSHTVGGDLDPPETPTGLTMTGLAGGYRAQWDGALAGDYAHTEIWSGTTSTTFANATQEGYLNGTIFERFGYPTSTDVRLWIRHVDRSGNIGGRVTEDVTTLAGMQGPSGDDATRGPTLFHIEITAAQQALLEAASDILIPTEIRDLANDETPGENLNGDFVRFYRTSPIYNDYWTWRGSEFRWERAEDFIGAAQINAVNINSITGSFADRLEIGNQFGVDSSGQLTITTIDGGLIRTGIVDADHIDADVRNWQQIRSATVTLSSSGTTYTISVSSPITGFSSLYFVFRNDEITRLNGHGAIDTSRIDMDSTPEVNVQDSVGDSMGSASQGGVQFALGMSTDGRTLYARPSAGRTGTIEGIWGVSAPT